MFFLDVNILIMSLLNGIASNGFVQLFRYVLVGGVAFVADFGLLYVLTEYVGWHYLWAATLSFLVGLAINYVLSIRWVFYDFAFKSRFWEFVVFAMIGVVGLGLNAFFLYFFTDICELYYLFSKLVSTGLVFMWNFLARKFILFSVIRIKEG